MEGEREQKIFVASSVQGNLVYGITGSAYNDDKSFSVMDECQKAALALRQSTCKNYLDYAERFLNPSEQK